VEEDQSQGKRYLRQIWPELGEEMNAELAISSHPIMHGKFYEICKVTNEIITRSVPPDYVPEYRNTHESSFCRSVERHGRVKFDSRPKPLLEGEYKQIEDLIAKGIKGHDKIRAVMHSNGSNCSFSAVLKAVKEIKEKLKAAGKPQLTSWQKHCKLIKDQKRLALGPLATIKSAVCNVMDINIIQLESNSHDRASAYARKVYYIVAMARSGKPSTDVGRAVNRDHSTVLKTVVKHNPKLDVFVAKVNETLDLWKVMK
jgi:Bacterial dnaA protein helix-turn-helix